MRDLGAAMGNEEELEWKAHGERAKEAFLRKDFLTAAMELERCEALFPDHAKTQTLLARARRLAAPQFWEVLPATLAEAGFMQFSECIFVQSTSDLSVTVELHDPSECNRSLSQCLVITVDNYDDPTSLADLASLEMQAHPDCTGLGQRLLKAIGDMVYMASPEADPRRSTDSTRQTPGDDFEARALAKLPSADELSHEIWGGARRVNAARALRIFTWGDALLSKNSEKLKSASGFHVNAKLLNGRGGGADTSENALEDGRIMLNVAESLAEGRGLQHLQQTIRRIEEEDTSCISIFCTKGRHRSVSMAMLLHKAYYPAGSVKHLTIS